MKTFMNRVDNFFKWVKGTELVELFDIDVSEDPVRPALDLKFRRIRANEQKFLSRKKCNYRCSVYGMV